MSLCVPYFYVAAAQLGKRGACHLFRHTMATLMLEAGAEIRFMCLRRASRCQVASEPT